MSVRRLSVSSSVRHERGRFWGIPDSSYELHPTLACVRFLLRRSPRRIILRFALCQNFLCATARGERKSVHNMPTHRLNLVRWNPFTGRKRKLPKRNLPRKRRKTMCSSLEERMCACDAMQAANAHLDCCHVQIAIVLEFLRVVCQNLETLSDANKKKCAAAALEWMNKARVYFSMAICCAQLDSDLLDLKDGQDDVRNCCFPPKDLRIDTLFQNDDQADQQIRLSKEEIRQLLDVFQLDEIIYVPQNRHLQGVHATASIEKSCLCAC